jgi:hypothetical protein
MVVEGSYALWWFKIADTTSLSQLDHTLSETYEYLKYTTFQQLALFLSPDACLYKEHPGGLLVSI